MAEEHNDELRDRVEWLEHKVKELEQRLEQANSRQLSNPAKSQTAEQPSAGEQESESHKKLWKTKEIQPGEQWLNRIGIGLLLIGIAFLFKYSIDQGWLIPPVRSAIGLGIGLILFVSGLQMPRKSTPMKQVLLGGGIATFYITGFATFQLYSFASGFVTWPFMVIVTLLALSLSLQQDEPILSVIGTLGALGTPFMLYTGSGSVVLLMLYTALVLVGSGIVYLYKGWKSLLWSIAAGGFVVMCVGVVNTTMVWDTTATVTLVERWALMIGTIIWVIASWILAASRTILTAKNPAQWPDPSLLLEDGSLDQNIIYKPSTSVHVLVFLVPLFILPLMIGMWDLSQNGTGVAAFALAVIGGLGYLTLKRETMVALASSHAFMSLVMLTIGFVLIFEGNVLFTVLAAEAVGLRYVAYQTSDEKLDVSAHILFGIVILWLFNLMRFSFGTSAMLGWEGITQLAFLAAGGMLLPKWIKKSDIRLVYRIVSHVVFLIWIYQAIAPLESGQAWVTVAWGAYGIILLVLGFIQYGRRIRLAGMSTIFLMVGKLFLVDLSQLQAIWRILLFMGFGAVFLFLGYYWQRQMNKGNTESPNSNS